MGAVEWVNIYVPLVIALLMILVVYIFKKKQYTEIEKNFVGLLLTTVLVIVNCISILELARLIGEDSIIVKILLKNYGVLSLIFIMFTSRYVGLYLCDNVENEKYNKSKVILGIITGIAIIICIIGPIYVKGVSVYGFTDYFVTAFYVVSYSVWTVCLIKYAFNKPAMKLTTLRTIVYTTMGAVALSVNNFKEDNIPIVGLCLFFYVYLIYFRTENPDIRYSMELKNAQEKTLNALSVKNDFLNTMNEQIDEPLKEILSASKEIQSYYNIVNDGIKDDIEFIVPTADNLGEIIGNINLINKIENNLVEKYVTVFNPTYVIEKNINKEKNRFADKNIDISFKAVDDFPEKLVGDEIHFSIIVQNLISNAYKYTKEGNIEIVAIVENKQNGKCNLKFKITDTGIGIKNETLVNLFTNFYKATEVENSNVMGTGLGLAITKKLVDILGGTITVESIFGSGTSFIVIIPFQYEM